MTSFTNSPLTGINTTSTDPMMMTRTLSPLTRALYSSLLLSVVAVVPVTLHAESHFSSSDEAVLADLRAPLPKLDSLADNHSLTLTLPQITHFQTKSGINVAFVQSTALPIVDVDLRFNAGSARDADIRPQGFGIANMTAAMLTQGTSSLSEDEFTRQVETLGIELSSRAFKDMFIVSLRSLSDPEHLTPALKLTEQMLTEPSFDPAILSRNKARLLVALQQQQQVPAHLAEIAFSQALYGDHPYAHPSTGTLSSVPNLTREDLIAFKNRYLTAANASLAITGDLSLKEAKALAETLTQALPQGKPAPSLPDPKPITSQRIHIPFDSTQTTIVMGQIGDKRGGTAQQLQAATNFSVGNEVLAGGDFNARLMTEIRKNLGYTYGISGGMTPMQAPGPYQISFSTRNDKADEAVAATLTTIKTTLNQGISPEELALTKDSLKNSFPMSFASNAGINGMLGMMNFYHLPDSYLTEYLSRLDKVTLKAANDSLKQKIDPDKFIIVTVGPTAHPSDTPEPPKQ